MRLKIIRLSVFLCLLLTLCIPVPVRALGIAMAPMTINLNDALRGAEYQRIVTVFNPSDTDDSYIIRAEGQAVNWLSFYSFESGQALQQFIIPGGSSFDVIVKVNIPSDTINGDYKATIYSETVPPTNSQNDGVSTIMQANTVLTIKVSGEQILEGTVGSITTHDTEVGIPLRLEIFFSNTGNVSVNPKIDCQITKDNNIVDNFSYSDTSVKPGSQATIPITWTSPADQLGEFVAKVTVSIGDKTLATQDINFKIMPSGTFTMQGELASLQYEGQPVLGNMLKIQAGFKNTGEAGTLTKMIAEVYLDGNLIDTLNSEETLVPIGQTGTLTSYLKPAKVGAYTIKVYVTYAGKQTETKEISFNTSSSVTSSSNAGGIVTSSSGDEKTSQPSGLSIPILVSVIGAIVVIGVIVMFLVRKKHRASL